MLTNRGESKGESQVLFYSCNLFSNNANDAVKLCFNRANIGLLNLGRRMIDSERMDVAEPSERKRVRTQNFRETSFSHPLIRLLGGKKC